MSEDILRNPKDPLHKVGPEVEKEILRKLGQLAHGFPRHEVLNAAWHLVLNVIRQEAETRLRAEKLFDEYAGRAKNTLLEQHYDLTGKRRNIFPFAQNLSPETFTIKQDFKKT